MSGLYEVGVMDVPDWTDHCASRLFDVDGARVISLKESLGLEWAFEASPSFWFSGCDGKSGADMIVLLIYCLN